MVIFDMVPRDFKVVKQSAIQGNTEDMAIEFLTVEQLAPMAALMANRQLINWRATFTLMISDRPVHREQPRRSQPFRFAVQLCTARFLGTFLENLSDTPNGVVAFIGQQLGIRNLAAFEDYCQSVTRKAHPVEIRRRYGIP